jgi:hypothetical protein
LNSPPREVAPDETHAEASKSFKSVELRLLMKEREDVASRLVALDHRIWALEDVAFTIWNARSTGFLNHRGR